MNGIVFLSVTHCICGLCVSGGRDLALTMGAMPAVAALQITCTCTVFFEAKSGVFLNKEVFLLHLGCIFVLQWNIMDSCNTCREKYFNAKIKPMRMVYS